MRSGKWLANVEADQPVSEVAHQAIELRLKVVKHYLRLASQKAQKNVEYVHQMRVSTRRAQSALRIFSDVVPQRRKQWHPQESARARTNYPIILPESHASADRTPSFFRSRTTASP